MLVALVCAVFALCAAVYLALPSAGQHAVLLAVKTLSQGAGPTGLRVTLDILLVAFALASFALLFAPGYRQYRYLTIPTSLIAPITVYVDAENLLSEQSIPAMITFLRKFLDGRRADLLFFMDAEREASSKKYKALYRFGFRPVDVPHNPIGTKTMDEAVDRELAMHAFERALLGPAAQEFIIVTSDGDFAPLVYRLRALGHSVQIWSSGSSNTYLKLAQYLSLTLVDLSQVLSEQRIEPPVEGAQPAARRPGRQTKRKRARRSPGARVGAQIAPPANLSEPGQEKLYYAIAETLRAHQRCEEHYALDAARNGQFHLLLNTVLAPRIASVGYSAGAWIDYWLDHLLTVGVFDSAPDHDFPATGSVSAEIAASQLYAMAKATAEAAAHATSNRPDGLLNMQVIIAQMETVEPTSGGTTALRALISPINGRRATHTRFFVRCARALGLIQFDDVQSSLDLIALPRLTPSVTPGDELTTSLDEQALPTDERSGG
jgi:uncharacterized LabA/DUF88 family protein